MTSRPRQRDFNRRKLWPWRWWMTIGVGVLATSNEGRTRNLCPDHIVLMADTMGSFGDEYSHARLHKTFVLPEIKLYATAANQIDKAAELMPLIQAHVAQLDVRSRTYGDVIRAVSAACFIFKVEQFTRSVLPKHRIAPEAFDPFKATPQIEAILQPEWEQFDIGCDLLIASFTGQGQAFLLCVEGREGIPQPSNFPGFSAIGSGFPNAMFWLAHRGHALGMSPLRAAYHAYEAKVMAEDAPNVNDHLDIVVANSDDYWHSTSHGWPARTKLHPEITADHLTTMLTEYGVRSTEQLDQKTDAKSAGD